jgi:hypothetical protein
VLRRVLGDLLDRRQALIPPRCDSRDRSTGLIETLLAYGVANFAAAPMGCDETVALEDG